VPDGAGPGGPPGARGGTPRTHGGADAHGAEMLGLQQAAPGMPVAQAGQAPAADVLGHPQVDPVGAAAAGAPLAQPVGAWPAPAQAPADPALGPRNVVPFAPGAAAQARPQGELGRPMADPVAQGGAAQESSQ
jgi:hypothetical protein